MAPVELMMLAMEQARLAAAADEVPIGCVIYHHPTGRIIGAAHNRRILDADPTAHAEILAIRQAAREIGDWRLDETTLAVTLEPCAMCAGAIAHARIARLFYAAPDSKGGGVEHGARVFSHPTCHHRPDVTTGLGEAESAALLKSFFASKR